MSSQEPTLQDRAWARFLLKKRLEKKLKQEALARKLDVVPNTVSKWERADQTPQDGKQNRIAEWLGLTRDELTILHAREMISLEGGYPGEVGETHPEYDEPERKLRLIRWLLYPPKELSDRLRVDRLAQRSHDTCFFRFDRLIEELEILASSFEPAERPKRTDGGKTRSSSAAK